MHPTALPSATGIGNLGSSARRFVDFLSEAGVCYWQICPLGPTGFGDSPYQTFSAFAGNPYLLDWDPLVDCGLLETRDLVPLQTLPGDHVNYGALYRTFWPVLRRASANFLKNPDRYPAFMDFPDFCAAHRDWLQPYAWFQVLKLAHNGGSWDVWPAFYRNYERARSRGLPRDFGEVDLETENFQQYLFWKQWEQLRAYANELGISIIGDIPIFAAYDSADLWSNPHLFQVNSKTGKPNYMAGVPPDFFSAEGQLWGNPLYSWEVHSKDGYAWWMRRLEINFQLYDVVRIDHFRGFHDYWRIPSRATSARTGKWQPGPGLPFFAKVRESFPEACIIAEDLGELNPEVHALRDATGLPGMAVLQFAFDGPDNTFLPHNHRPNLVVYSGTHDNNTSRGWYEETDEETRDFFRRYLRVNGSEAPWDLIRAAYASSARIAVIPLQDLLGLGREARFNTPGVGSGNWQWRFTAAQLDNLEARSAPYLRELAWLYQRA